MTFLPNVEIFKLDHNKRKSLLLSVCPTPVSFPYPPVPTIFNFPQYLKLSQNQAACPHWIKNLKYKQATKINKQIRYFLDNFPFCFFHLLALEFLFSYSCFSNTFTLATLDPLFRLLDCHDTCLSKEGEIAFLSKV